MTRGIFISFEGGEGSGKSVQAKLLAEALAKRGHEAVLTREPGGTAAGERIREIVLHAQEIALSPEAQVLLYSTARAQNVREVIRPALEAGKLVIADRFFDSTMAYQGYGHGVPLDDIRAVTALACGDVVPDRTFLLDMPVDKGLARSGWRAQSKWDRFEVLDTAFHQRVRDGYLRLAADEPGRWVIIDADRGEQAIADAIGRELHLLLGARAAAR
jgi:dTMP kinase